MTIKSLTDRECSNRHISRLLGVSEGTVRYHRRRQAAGTPDGRSCQQSVAARFHAAIEAYVSASGEESPSTVAALHAWLVSEHDYPASLRSVQRHVRQAYPPPARRARRRVVTPPGVQAQADWASFPGVWVGGTRRDLLVFLLTLSFSRAWALVWSERQTPARVAVGAQRGPGTPGRGSGHDPGRQQEDRSGGRSCSQVMPSSPPPSSTGFFTIATCSTSRTVATDSGTSSRPSA